MAQDSSLPDFWDKRYDNDVMPWDTGGVPTEFTQYAEQHSKSTRILIPGCGTGYEVAWLAAQQYNVTAVEFSPSAIQAAQRAVGEYAQYILEADFFHFDAPNLYDWVYERAFLCALPRKMWLLYAQRMADLIPRDGVLAGYFYLTETHRGPPFGCHEDELHTLLSPNFVLEHRQTTTNVLPIFESGEHWLIWRRR